MLYVSFSFQHWSAQGELEPQTGMRNSNGMLPGTSSYRRGFLNAT